MNPHRIDGPLLKNRREKPKLEFGHMVKGLGAVMGKDILPDVKMPKPKRSYQPRLAGRHKHNMQERIIEKAIIRYLRGKGFKCGKVNPEIGSWNAGIADILVFTPSAQWYIEVKTEEGTQQDNQIEFQEICQRCGVNYMVARSIEDVKSIC
jgi:hypothetical protein